MIGASQLSHFENLSVKIVRNTEILRFAQDGADFLRPRRANFSAIRARLAVLLQGELIATHGLELGAFIEALAGWDVALLDGIGILR